MALARAAVEDALRKKHEKIVGKPVAAKAKLGALIDSETSRAKALTREGRNLAHKVRIEGNKVLHGHDTGLTNALEVMEAAREVILELAGVMTRPETTSNGT